MALLPLEGRPLSSCPIPPVACLLQASSSPLGSSPLGSFESEWLAFMTSSISHGRSKQRKRSQRGMGGPGAASAALEAVCTAATAAVTSQLLFWLTIGCRQLPHLPGEHAQPQPAPPCPAAARPEGPAIYHLKRVEQPQPSSKHPHCGLWAGDYGPSGLEVSARQGPAANTCTCGCCAMPVESACLAAVVGLLCV